METSSNENIESELDIISIWNKINPDLVKNLSSFFGTEKMDINTQDKFGRTLLMYSCIHKDKGLAKFLIEQKNIQLGVRDRKGNNVLIYAMKFLLFDIAKILIEKGCDINIKNNDGYTPLFWLMKQTCQAQKIAYNNYGVITHSLPSIHEFNFHSLEAINMNQKEEFEINEKFIKEFCEFIVFYIKHKNFDYPEHKDPISGHLICSFLVLVTSLGEHEGYVSFFTKYLIKPLIRSRKMQDFDSEFEILSHASRCPIPDLLQCLLDNNFKIEEPILEGQYDSKHIDLIRKELNRRKNIEIKKRNSIGVLLLSTREEKKIHSGEKRKFEEIESTNPLTILPKELVHLVLSYSHPLAPPKKYFRNTETNEN